MLPVSERLTRRRDFSAVYARKRSFANALLVLYVRRHPQEGTDSETRRYGFSVSKKVGKAHDRNRVKRRLREICRLKEAGWKRGFDAVFVVRSDSATSPFSDLEKAVETLIQQAGLLLAKQEPSATEPVRGVSEPSGGEL